MKPRRYQAEDSRVYAAPRSLVWALVSDTNRSDRALGLAPATYRWDNDEDTGQPVRVAAARELGVALEWTEPPYEWVEGRFVAGRRDFTKGPVTRGDFRAELEDAEDGRTVLRATVGMETVGFLGVLLGPIQRLKMRSALRRYFDAIGEILREWDPGADATDQPAAVRVRRLLASGFDEITSGPKTDTNLAMFEQRARRLKSAPVDPAVVDRLLLHLRERPDEEVAQMQPFELANTWGLDRREVLRAFLHASVAGLTDLRWQVNCPVCRVGASIARDLSSVGASSHCDACQIEYDTDFAKYVEAVFPINEAVRAVTPALFCASSPAFLPHVLAQLRVGPGETRELPADLPGGEIHVRVLGRSGGSDLVAPTGSSLSVRVGDGSGEGVEATLEGESAALRVTNDGEKAAVVLVERAGWSADAVLGTVIASFPEFLDLFATEAPSSGVELRVGQLALLFSDLVGSTALYEEVGDARAYALVEEHFRLAERAVRDAGGAVVKTMGDAVMASFASVPDAVRAAKAMIASHQAADPVGSLGVKIGVHGGPCLAVRANDRLDYFGTTVNVTARLQAQAAPSEVVVTRESYDDPTVSPLLDGMPMREIRATLKGIAVEQHLVGIHCGQLTEAPRAEKKRARVR
jgi:class 3 adenylate cyclase